MAELAELVFVPASGAGHLVSTVEIAKLLVARDSRIAVSILILNFPSEPQTNTPYSSHDSDRIKLVELPRDKPKDPAEFSMTFFIHSFYEGQKPHVRDAFRRIASGPTRISGLVVDMFCTSMIDVADEFGIPSYVFYTSGAAFFIIASHLQESMDREGDVELGSNLVIPSFVNLLPTKLLPSVLNEKTTAVLFYNHMKRIRNTKGVLVNTFTDLEPNMLDNICRSGTAGFPPVYPVGPIINLNQGNSHVGLGVTDRKAEILAWLDEQPPSSVVFLCFGSMGSFGEDQVREIAFALEQSGVRFLWSLRKPPQKQDKSPFPIEYMDLNEILPEGFLDRTAKVGKVVGWAPQVSVLGHPAVGGFVSHCGWNSILESLWFGVPIATWPLYAEQQFNAFMMVKEFGLAFEISLDYKRDVTNSGTGNASLVKADQIKNGIERLMEKDSEIRKKVEEMSEKSRKALLDGGSSYTSLSRFINDVFENRIDN